eukprot:3652172-Pleurochrysis_carterae.AAC.1
MHQAPEIPSRRPRPAPGAACLNILVTSLEVLRLDHFSPRQQMHASNLSQTIKPDAGVGTSELFERGRMFEKMSSMTLQRRQASTRMATRANGFSRHGETPS